MRKVLILAYDFPPYVSVGGIRPYNWFKYLHEFDYHPVVITRQWEIAYGNELDYVAPGSSSDVIIEDSDLGTIIRTPYQPNLSNRILLKHGPKRYRIVRKSISAFYEVAQFILPLGPKVGVYRAANEYLNKNKVDAIVATGEPFVLFHYAKNLSAKYNIPWIADYRDPWSNGVHKKQRKLLNLWKKFIERRTVKTTSHITTVDQLFKRKIQGIFNDHKITILPNGFDPDAIKEARNIVQNNEELRIAFVGTIYDWHPLEIFLRKFNEFISKEPKKIRLVFYGTNKNDIIEKLSRIQYPKLANHIEIHDKIPNDRLIALLAKDNVMLLFNYYAFTGTKIYDYLGLKRKILFCFANDPEANMLKEKHYSFQEVNNVKLTPQKEIINECKAGVVVDSSNELDNVLEDIYNEFIEKGYVTCNSVGVMQYSRKEQVKLLAQVLNSL